MAFQCSECGAFVGSNPGEFDLNNITIAPRTLARISQLLATNEPPQEPELTILRPIAQKTAAQLACIDAEIARLRDQLKHLEEERAALADYHVQNTTILSPLRRMPSEVMNEIFLWTLPLQCEPDMSDSPWVLTHVSRRWRAITISQSSLWSQICLDFSLETEYSSAMVRTQIERARALYIIFYGSKASDSDHQVDMLQLLLERSSVWKELRLELTAALVPPMAACRRRFPLLRKALVQWDGAESQAGIESIEFFRMAASLADITVHSIHDFIPTLLPTSHRLTRYEFDAPWTTHYELLKTLPNLVEVRILRTFDRGVPWPTPGDPINLVHLRCMYVSHVECLDYLRAPALERIAIQHHKGVEIRPHLDPFVERSSCVFRTLCIAGLPDAQRTEEILQHYPSITELVIWIADSKTKDKDIERNALAAIFTGFTMFDPTRIFPRISQLHFASRNADAISYPLYLDMLESWRSASGCALKATELLVPEALGHPDPESLARMATLREAGLRICCLSANSVPARADQWLHTATAL